MLIGCYRLNNGKWERFDVISKTESTIWTKRFYEVGSFQMTIKNNIFKKYDLISHDGKCGIVMRVQETWQGCNVYGYDLKGIAHFRTMKEQTISAGTNVETTLREWVTTCLLTGERAIEGLILEEPQEMTKTFSEELTISEGAKLSDVLEEQCKKYGIGWDITFNKGVLTFSFIEPRDNPDIVFSRKHRTLEGAERILDAYDEVNNSGTGIFRREGDTITEASDYITGTATPKAVGYLLGDNVKVEEFGLAASQQVTEMQFVYEPNNIIVVPSFGEVKKNIIKKLMKG